MKRHGHLFENVLAFENFLRAFRNARRGKRTKRQVVQFDFAMEWEVLRLLREIESGQYRPRPYRTFYVHDPKRRRISAAHFRDRVVHHAVCQVLDPLFERWFIFDSYACRVGKGTHRAVRRAQSFAQQAQYFLKCDVRHCFESVDHRVLKALLCRRIKDDRLLALLDTIIDAPVPGCKEGKGLAIGNLTSQYFANFYLTPMDLFVQQDLGVNRYLRYMDDFVLFHDSKACLQAARGEITHFLREQLLLELNPRVSHVAPVTQGLPFLGFRVFPRLLRLKHRGLVRLAQRLRGHARSLAAGQVCEDDVVRSAQSLIGHAAFGNTLQLRRKLFGTRQSIAAT